MSIYLSESLGPEGMGLITPMSAVAVAEALEDCGSSPAGIKWVNDVYIGEKKVCGILAESSFGGSGPERTIVGIGINIKEPEGGFPEEISGRAGAAFLSPTDETRDRLLEAVLKRFAARLSGLKSRDFIKEYRRRSILDGRTVTVVGPGGESEAKVIGIDGDCRLIVETAEGAKALYCGEVTIKM